MNDCDSRLMKALRSVFFHLANLLLKNRIAIGPVIQQLKIAYAEAARTHHGRSGSPASVNMIANITGMSRNHVGDLLSLARSQQISDNLGAPAESNLLGIWHSQEDYTDNLGLPRPLEIGPGRGTLQALIADSLGETDAAEIVRQLVAAGSIRQREDGLFEMSERSFMINSDLPRVIAVFLESMASSVDKNWGRDVSDSLFMRVAHSSNLDSHKIAMIRRIVREQSESFLEEMDDLLSRHQDDSENPMLGAEQNLLSRVGVCVYYFEMDK